MSENLIK